MPATFTEAEILAQLDACADEFVFPMLDNGYVYLVDTRLRAFGDATRWAILIEIVGYSPRAGQLDDALHLYGNCLARKPGTANEDFVCVVPCVEIESETEPEHARRGLTQVPLRGVLVDITPDAEPRELFDLFRSLTPTHRDHFFASEREIRARVPPDLPELLRLEAWHHPDLLNEQRPSKSETFQAIARVLVTGNASAYRVATPPNTHWSNWPEGGSL